MSLSAGFTCVKLPAKQLGQLVASCRYTNSDNVQTTSKSQHVTLLSICRPTHSKSRLSSCVKSTITKGMHINAHMYVLLCMACFTNPHGEHIMWWLHTTESALQLQWRVVLAGTSPPLTPRLTSRFALASAVAAACAAAEYYSHVNTCHAAVAYLH